MSWLRVWWVIASIGLGSLAIPLTAAAQPAAEAKPGNETIDDTIDALDEQIARLSEEGKHNAAVPFALRSLALAEQALGSDSPGLAARLNNVAEILRKAHARPSEAEMLYTRSLAALERAGGDRQLDIAAVLGNLGMLYEVYGRYGDAELLLKRSLAIEERSLGRDDPRVAQTLNNLAVVHWSQGRFVESEQLHRRALAIRESALGPDHPQIGESLNNLAVLLRSLGRFAEAEPLYRRDLATTERLRGPDHPDLAIPLDNLAGLFRSQQRFDEAVSLARRALAIREAALGPDHPDVAGTLNRLAVLYNIQGHLAEAEPLQRRALATLEAALGPDHPDLAPSVNNLAELLREQKRHAEAETLSRRALAISEKALGAGHPDVAHSLNNLAGILREQKRLQDAEPLLIRALEIRLAVLGRDHIDVAESFNNLAWIALAQQDLARAAGYWRDATGVLQRRAERRLLSTGATRGEAQVLDFFFTGLVKVTHRLPTETDGERRERMAAMFETAQWAQASEAAASLAQMAARSASGSTSLAALVRERQDLVAEWQVKDRLAIAARSQPTDQRDAKAERELSQRLSAIDERIAAIDARLGKSFSGYAALASPKPLPLTDVQAALRDDEALVLFLDTGEAKPLPEETFVWAVTRTEARWVRVEAGKTAVTDYVASLRCGLDDAAWKKEGDLRCRTLLRLAARPAKDEPLPFSPGIAHELYDALFGQVADLITGKHLIIVPSGALTRLPFQVLVTEPPPSEGFAKARWLARDHAITILPAVSSLGALRRVGRPSAAKRPMIGFGNPLLDGLQADKEDGATYKERAELARSKTSCTAPASLRPALWRGFRRGPEAVPQPGGLASLDYLRVQPPLPETADELCAVARDLKADVREIRIGARATETEIKRLSASGDLARYRVVHFATHGTLAGQIKGASEPGLILTPPKTATREDDGYLSASEIAGLKLDADWVILSACNTAGAETKGEAAEALSGLARAFIYAGARALLVSHWPVESDPTVKLISTAAREEARNPRLGRAEALRRAMLALVNGGDEAEAHPANWAPFVLVGEGGAGR